MRKFLIGAIFGILLTSVSVWADAPMQVVLMFRCLHPDGKTRIFIPKETVGFGLTPLDNPAPLSENDLSVCQLEIVPIGVRFYNGKQIDNMNEILFHCGSNRYIFNTLVLEKK